MAGPAPTAVMAASAPTPVTAVRDFTIFDIEANIVYDYVGQRRPNPDYKEPITNYLQRRPVDRLTAADAPRKADQLIEQAKSIGTHWACWLPGFSVTWKPRHLKPRTQPSGDEASAIGESYQAQPLSILLSKAPPEVRNRIYKHALTVKTADKSVTTVNAGKDDEVRGLVVGTESAKQPGLLRTCRQLRAEAMPIFYSRNVFVFHIESVASLLTANSWLEGLPLIAANNLQNINMVGFASEAPGYRMEPVCLGVNLRNIKGYIGARPHRDKYAEWFSKRWREAGRLLGKIATEDGHVVLSELHLRMLVFWFTCMCEDTSKPEGQKIIQSECDLVKSFRYMTEEP